ncbi:sushi, von Willebrand factor type A, EGF and pentraxin domain-containing protein 1-like [Halichondria panicea]|uniref:sushi, von Willebrand factor type A, EGF and pentraxin domain-containing protein 1-like n=1 Tax=Halichondria panicea TaxID=6063 RepID=UPI00312BC0DA
MMAFSIVSILPFILVVTICNSIGHAQPVFLTLGSTNITSNNTEILITDIGQDASGGLPSLTCHTDLPACCRSFAENNGQGSLGQWRYPDGSVILNNGLSTAVGNQFYITRNAPQLIRLNRRETNNPLTPTGSYCCVVPTTHGEMTFCANLVVCLSLPHPTNGMISYSDPTLGVGSVATFSCDPGFMISDVTNTITCQEDGQWSSIPPTCMEIGCQTLNTENAMVTYSGDTTEPYIYGTTATYQCNPGYEITSGDSERTCTGDVRSSVGEWSGRKAVCSVVSCEPPTPPSDGEVSLPAGTAFSSVAHYSCHPCYRLVGVSLQICIGNGMWIPPPPTCEILGCNQPPDLDNGAITTPYIYTMSCGSMVTYNCDRGYLLEGVSSRTCQTNGEWSNGTILCNPIDCGSLSSPDDGGVVLLSGTTFMSRATYSCNSGYLLRGTLIRTCGPDGQWSQYPPSCEPVDCGALMNPTNGRVDSLSGTTFMDRATYTCNTGHNRVGTSSRMCLANGVWSSVKPTCKVVDCGALEYPTNGKVVILQGTTFDQPAVYSCNEGYTLNGDARRTCTASGHWSGSAPSCDPVDCGDLSAPVNGYVAISRGTHFMDTAVYSCAPGYNFTGCPSAVCQSNGTWSCDPPFCADNAMIQLKFGPTSYCVEWNDEKAKLMYKIMHIAITKAVGKSGYDIPMNNIQPGYFTCYKSTTRTTYRTMITGTKSLSAVEYAELIREWVESGVTTRVLWYAIRMDKACPVVIASMDQEECV